VPVISYKAPQTLSQPKHAPKLRSALAPAKLTFTPSVVLGQGGVPSLLGKLLAAGVGIGTIWALSLWCCIYWELLILLINVAELQSYKNSYRHFAHLAK